MRGPTVTPYPSITPGCSRTCPASTYVSTMVTAYAIHLGSACVEQQPQEMHNPYSDPNTGGARDQPQT
eukprot:m.609937 g.609937  ORF g.609937 m.609937 type:complete len:68 (-) comp22493_c0_seq1:10-213(-)